MVRCALLSFVTAITAGCAFAQDTVPWKDNIQGWQVAVDRTLENSCFIVSQFENDFLVRFQFNSTQHNVQLIVANASWGSLVTGQDYGVEIAFGEKEPWTGTATGHVWNGILPSLVLSVPIEDKQASFFIDEMTAAPFFRMSYEGAQIADLALYGADAAIASLLSCQKAMGTVNEAQEKGSDPFAPKPDPI